jgi:hypothetical protein
MPHLRSKKPKATSEKASPGPSVKLRKRRLPEASLAPAKQSIFAIGDPVSHPQFGDGSVTAIDGDTLTIAFADHQVRQILDYYVKRHKK